VARNYLEVYIYERWSDRSLPQFQEGQRFQVQCQIFDFSIVLSDLPRPFNIQLFNNSC